MMDTNQTREPARRARHAMTFDSRRGMVVMFGGRPTYASFAPPLVSERGLDANWSSFDASGPASRTDPAKTYDVFRQRVLLFGGRPETGSGASDFWSWVGPMSSSGVGAWVRIPEQGTWPQPRQMAAISYDFARNRVLLDGGTDGQGLSLQDSWEWDGSTWSSVPTGSHRPGARSAHSVVYDPDRKRHILLADAPAGLDVWELHADPDQRPGLLVSFDWAASQVTTAEAQSMSLAATAGGRGYTVVMGGVGAPVAGIGVSLWDARVGAWKQAGGSNADYVGPQSFTVASQAVGDPKVLLSARARIDVIVQASAGTGNGPLPPRIRFDGAELRADDTLVP